MLLIASQKRKVLLPCGGGNDRVRLAQSLRSVLRQENPVLFSNRVINWHETKPAQQFFYVLPLRGCQSRFGEKLFSCPGGVVDIELPGIKQGTSGPDVFQIVNEDISIYKEWACCQARSS